MLKSPPRRREHDHRDLDGHALFSLPDLSQVGRHLSKKAGECFLRIDSVQTPRPAQDRRTGETFGHRLPIDRSGHREASSNLEERGGNPVVRDAFFADHAKDLICRLSQWSLQLDEREKDLDQRERVLERRARNFRQLQWLASATSTNKHS